MNILPNNNESNLIFSIKFSGLISGTANPGFGLGALTDSASHIFDTVKEDQEVKQVVIVPQQLNQKYASSNVPYIQIPAVSQSVQIVPAYYYRPSGAEPSKINKSSKKKSPSKGTKHESDRSYPQMISTSYFKKRT